MQSCQLVTTYDKSLMKGHSINKHTTVLKSIYFTLTLLKILNRLFHLSIWTVPSIN